MPDETREDAWHEREYNPRVTVADISEILAEWPRRAARTRASRPFDADLPTGDHPRDVVDIFRAEKPKGTVVFIHGGYWRALSKVETAWVADGFVDQGYSVALMNYPLCPEVSLEVLTNHVRRSFARLWQEHLSPQERKAVVVTGHSAGGHLTAMMIATDWTIFGLPARPFHGAVSISGLFELSPLLRTSMNQAIRLDAATAARLSPAGLQPLVGVPLALVVGGLEPNGFHHQGDILAQAWPGLNPQRHAIPDRNHFTVVDEFAMPGSFVNTLAIGMLEAADSLPSTGKLA